MSAIEKAGIAFELLEYAYDPDADEIGLDAARALGRHPATVFKTLIVSLDSGELVCAVIPSSSRLNVKAVAAAVNVRKCELADARKAERSTGYVIGGISPLGQRKPLRTFVDASALPLEQMVVNGGRRGLQLALRPQDLVALTSAVALPLQA